MFQGVVKPSSKDKLAVQNALKVVNFNLKNSAKLKSDNAHILRFVILIYIYNKMQRYTVYFNWKLLYMFRVVPPPIIRSANNCIYSIWYLSHRYCYLPLS